MKVTDLAPISIIIVVAGITIGAGSLILSQMGSNVCNANTTAIAGSTLCSVCCANNTQAPASYFVYTNASSGIQTLASWLPTIALVIAAAIIIGIVFGSFVLGRKGE